MPSSVAVMLEAKNTYYFSQLNPGVMKRVVVRKKGHIQESQIQNKREYKFSEISSLEISSYHLKKGSSLNKLLFFSFLNSL